MSKTPTCKSILLLGNKSYKGFMISIINISKEVLKCIIMHFYPLEIDVLFLSFEKKDAHKDLKTSINTKNLIYRSTKHKLDPK